MHLLNYTNPAMHRGWIRELIPIGAQKVVVRLPAGKKIARVELLRAEKTISFTPRGNVVEFTVPGIVDYEGIALT